MRAIGWKLDREDREDLLERFPPVWPDVIADHITLDTGAGANGTLPCATCAEIVGHVNDGEGLQALVVAIDGTTDRPDGSTYHITWSIDRACGREPVESNAVLSERGWETLRHPLPIRVIPACFE